MASRHKTNKINISFNLQHYGVIQGGCAKLVAYFLDILFMAVMHTLIHSAGADAYIGAKHQNTFEDNSIDKGKK